MMKNIFLSLALLLIVLPMKAHAFCGFFVSKADASLFNEASKVIIARHENRTVITMANDFQGDTKEFAMVIPVPTVIKEGQVNVTENRIIDHLDAYTAPRLVEYFDEDPCRPQVVYEMMAMDSVRASGAVGQAKRKAVDLGVTVEASYSVGEYDIEVLSAEQSDGLLIYLNQEGYKLPENAARVLGSYMKQGMKFFVTKVNLEQFEKQGYSYLRPLQVAFETQKFGLPIRLGTLNAKGPQDLILMTLTKKGRVEAKNYRTVKIPTGMDIPIFVKEEFGKFYQDMFTYQAEKENLRAVFTEYAWNMNWCDPCAADPLSNDELKTLGVWWIGQNEQQGDVRMIQRAPIAPPQAAEVYVTRLHMRYTGESFPEDIALQETPDSSNFQGRYVLRHPWKGVANCPAGTQYMRSLPARFEKEAQNLANLTGWQIHDIRTKMGDMNPENQPELAPARPWWEDMWDKKKN